MGGLGGGGGAGSGEEVPPPEGNLRALLDAALAEIERFKAAEKAREPPQEEKGQ
jgi:hypothetical protein